MTTQENLLVLLMEECNETAQRASKALRFTPEEVQPGQLLSNAERVVYEFNDIIAVMEILCDSGFIEIIYDQAAIDLKKEKVKKYLQYSKELGAVK